MEDLEKLGKITDPLGLCGCFSNSVAVNILNVLKETDGDTSYYTEIATKLNLSPDHVELILHVLDNAGMTEHGTGIRGSWITDAGRAFIPVLEGYLNEEGT